MLPAAWIFLTLTNFDFARSSRRDCPHLRRADTEESQRDAELSTFQLREAPSLTTPVVYDVCSEEKETILFIHLRRGGGTTMVYFLKGIQKYMCHGDHMIHHVETYLGSFGKDRCWSLEREFLLKEPAIRPVTVINLRDPFERMWSLYNFEQRYTRTVGFRKDSLQNSSSPVWIEPPEKHFKKYPDNFYVRVLCCANNKGKLLEEKIGRSHLSRAMKVLEHEIGIIAIFEWFQDPRFTHYLYSTLNTTKVLPYECFRYSFDMADGQRDLLGKIRFTDPVFEETWRRNNSFDFELYHFARRLAWHRVMLFWNVTNGELLPLVLEPRVSNYDEWKEKALERQTDCWFKT